LQETIKKSNRELPNETFLLLPEAGGTLSAWEACRSFPELPKTFCSLFPVYPSRPIPKFLAGKSDPEPFRRLRLVRRYRPSRRGVWNTE
jgi:hypothetical protein